MKSKKILLAGYFEYEWYESAWGKSLTELGNNVTRFNIKDYYSFNFIKNHLFIKRFSYFYSKINSEFLNRFHIIKPDIVLINKGYHFEPNTLIKIKDNSWITGFDNDDLFGGFTKEFIFKRMKGMLPLYGSYHCYREKNIADYKKYIENVSLLRSYYLPWLHYPSSNSFINKNKIYDVVFIGHAEYDNRIKYIEAILKNDIQLRLFGNLSLWKKYIPNNFYNKISPPFPVYYDKYRKTIQDSRICLCFFSKKNNDTYTRRVFEIPACGSFLLSERTDTMLELFKEGIEAEYFSSQDELIEKIQFYLTNYSAREKIAKSGYERCMKSGYDINSRMKQWLQDIDRFMI